MRKNGCLYLKRRFMAANLYLTLCAIILCFCGNCSKAEVVVPFDESYVIDWGAEHITFLDQGRQVQILIDPTSGGGFRSKDPYGSGYFHISLKIPTNAGGIATTFYLTSEADNSSGGGHDELDFELLGRNRPPYILNTNIYAQDSGHREQQFSLWFDPTYDFHDYGILWNQKQVVDNIPIRVFKNNNDTTGAKFPKSPMYVHASLWNGSQWLGQTDWSRGPFVATYRGFEINGCCYEYSNPQKCESSEYPWNAPQNWELTLEQQYVYNMTKNRYIMYDYCTSDLGNDFPECSTFGSQL
ncbi:hypothetical protein OROMI_030907 [Orobanche minor]